MRRIGRSELAIEFGVASRHDSPLVVPMFNVPTLAARARYSARQTSAAIFRENSVLCTLPDSPGNQRKHNACEIRVRVWNDLQLVRTRR